MAMVEMNLMVSPVIDRPPNDLNAMYARACAADDITIKSWEKDWIDFTRKNAKRYNFTEQSAMAEFGKETTKPIIVAGSGPSLKINAMELKLRGDIRVVSCLHNFAYFEDNDLMTAEDYYVTLDSGPIAITEVAEGGAHDEDWYWERSKGKTLIAYTATHPDLLAKWQGRILFFASPVPSEKIQAVIKENVDITKVPTFNVGGNVLGASLYFAKAILGGGVMIFIGADFAFDYTHKFHAWNSSYDAKFSGVIPVVDIFGNRRWTWQSYLGFKTWFDYVACGGKGGNPQLFINATQGGIFGAYPEGNIKQVIQLDLKSALYIFNMSLKMPELLASAKDNPTLLY